TYNMMITGCLVIVGLAWLLQWWHFRHWLRLKVPSIKVTPSVGNIWRLLRGNCSFAEQFRILYESEAARGHAYVGIHVLHNHALLLREPALIKRILVEDFMQFSSRFESTDTIGDTMGTQNLFFAKYELWRETHKILAPFFAVGKVRHMFTLFQQIGIQLEHHLDRQRKACGSENGSFELEVKQLSALFSTDIIALLVFGLDAKCLQRSGSEFRQMCLEVNEPRPKRLLHLFTMFFFPRCCRLLRTHLYSEKYERFMRHSINSTLKHRIYTGEQRNDLIDIFRKLQLTHPPESILHNCDFFVAQAAFLLLAGFDTSSSTITFALYELAKHPAIQQHLRHGLKQILNANGDVQMDYDTLSLLPYLRQVVDEVLRLYPPAAFLDRCCNSNPSYNMTSCRTGPEFCIAPGTPVYISVLGLHRDEEYWTDPHKFDPDRFAPEKRQQHRPMTYLPFGAGPRGCIGPLLGLLEVKVGLIYILKNYRVETCDRTQIDIKFDAKALVLTPARGTYLRFVYDCL
ncbi:hypothetical protein KR044_010834, partial [Drosophila immigrans]